VFGLFVCVHVRLYGGVCQLAFIFAQAHTHKYNQELRSKNELDDMGADIERRRRDDNDRTRYAELLLRVEDVCHLFRNQQTHIRDVRGASALVTLFCLLCRLRTQISPDQLQTTCLQLRSATQATAAELREYEANGGGRIGGVAANVLADRAMLAGVEKGMFVNARVATIYVFGCRAHDILHELAII
jgi:hypothetical protein